MRRLTPHIIPLLKQKKFASLLLTRVLTGCIKKHING